MNPKRLHIGALALLLAPVGPALHAVPPQSSIQGVLLGPDGAPLSGERAYSLTFYDDPESPEAISEPLSGNVLVEDSGRWVIVYEPSVFVLGARELWYELGIDSRREPDGVVDPDDMFPRRFPLHSSVFARMAGDAQMLGGFEYWHYATAEHDHDADYAPLWHNHDGLYSLLSHGHDGVYSPASHNHNATYALLTHNHSGVYSLVTHNHNATYSLLTHDHNGVYAPFDHLVHGASNTATGSFAGVAGGDANDATGNYAAIGGGGGNRVSADAGTIGGGGNNQIDAEYGVIGGGEDNHIIRGAHATIAGGGRAWTALGYYANDVHGDYGTIGGGGANTAGSSSNTAADSAFATVGGGFLNSALAKSSTVGGGALNSAGGSGASAAGNYATVPGGYYNAARGDYSFAAGRRARANHLGAFVWGDSTDAEVPSERDNQFRVRAGGGVRLDVAGAGLNPPGLDVITSGATAVGLHVQTASNDACAVFTNTGAGSTIKAYGGGDRDFEVYGNGNAWLRGTLAQGSDRDAKTAIQPVDTRAVLETLVSVPVSTWAYKHDEATTHMGPMAQDLHAAFGLGANDTSIAAIDADGLSMAAIQGLHQIVQEQQAMIEELRREIEQLKAAQPQGGTGQ